ncbi:NUDIX domain-containing protein [Salinibacillus kushneri]|uniref:NUDIX domain-containing protein n=1 Tax=Salinibacillus kushneri TaxID=237682 RepID=A0A1I0DZ08_9BACI|nr:NUDIX hydrolase [Salinibacillus kushneri]SET37090.1 NUDIX domain-containing protein [Salinibacillus kushneri]
MPVKPKPASTVILMDEVNHNVYLTKRPDTMKFLGGFYVFPGGAVEKEDNPSNEWSYRKNEYEHFPPAHYIAAARELFEEVGVLLVKEKGPFVFHHHSKDEYRQLLVKSEISFLDMLEQERLQFDLSSLQYFGHRITPESSPIRFDTRFFIANLPKGQTPDPDWNEIDYAVWSSPQEALEKNQQGLLAMVSPTITSLETIVGYFNGGPLIMPRQENQRE